MRITCALKNTRMLAVVTVGVRGVLKVRTVPCR